jgi:hypothetical protein
MTADIQPKSPHRKRKALSKKLRFEVFKRDRFTCQYCGATPPSVVLQCDHIVPVAEGGGNEIDNLVTACEPCNLGKAARSLDAVPQSLAEKAEQTSEAEAQLAGYVAIMREKKQRIENDVWEVIEALRGETRCLKSEFKSAQIFVERLGVLEAVKAAEIARAKVPWRGQKQWKYFCGVCWTKIKALENG